MVASFGFMGSKKIGDIGISNTTNENIKYWIDLSFLEEGACDTINLNETDYDYRNLSKLSSVEDRVYGEGRVYQAPLKNWVWEEGIQKQYDFETPVVCSGLWIGGEFHSKTAASGDLKYSIDYRNGRAIFDNAYGPDVAYGSGNVPVCAEYSYKRIYVVTETELVKTFAESDDLNNPIGSGEDVLNDQKIPLPAVVISERNHEWAAYQLGGYKKCLHQTTAAVFSSDSEMGENIVDILSQQENKKIPSIDWTNCESPFDWMGDINPLFSGVYEIQSAYPWINIYVLSAAGLKNENGIRMGSIEFLIESSPHM